MGVHIALLRGINVGGKNKLPMKDLAVLFGKTGCREVRTYIQSGNVVFEASASAARSLSKDLASAITKQFKLDVPVVLRSAEELRAVTEGNPYLRAGVAPEALHVAFLADQPTKAQVGSLDPKRSPPDAFQVIGREIYLHFPAGLARSKLTNAYFDSRLDTVSTVRNWRTVETLLAMATGKA